MLRTRQARTTREDKEMEKVEEKGENEGRRQLEGGSATQHQRRSTERKPGDSWREVTSQAVGLESHQGFN